MFTLQHLISLLSTYKYGLLFPLAVIDGPIVAVLAAFLASMGHLNVFWVYLIVVLGDIVGDSLYYAVGRFGGRRFLKRWGKRLGVSEEALQKVDHNFHQHPGKTLLIGKWTHAFVLLFLVAAGLAEMPFWRFLFFIMVGTLVKSLVFVLLGFYFGQAYQQIDDYLNYFATLPLVLVGLVLMVYFVPKIVSYYANSLKH